MRISKACMICRQRKVKCVFNEHAPCNYCKINQCESSCKLYTTQEYRRIKNSKKNIQGTEPTVKIELSELTVERSIELALQHFPELFFFNFGPSVKICDSLDPLVILSVYVLTCPFNGEISKIEKSELLSTVELRLFSRLEDKNSLNFVSILQASILMLLINWQNANTYKGFLVGGIADRAYKVLFNQKLEYGSILEREIFLKTIWSYQLITLSLRDGSINDVKSRLYKFRLPLDNMELLFGQESEAVYMEHFDVEKSHNLTSLLIKSAEIWIDCLAWVMKGGKNYFKEAPWNVGSEWNKLEQRTCLFLKKLGGKERFNANNLDAFFALGQGNLYCSLHLTIMISRIMLHRDFIPFIPIDTEGPKGPFDELPWLDHPPLMWWQQSATTVFETARDASLLFATFKDKQKYGCSTFNGFIALTVASVLSYIKHFPSYDSSFKDATKYYDYCLEYLAYYKKHLELGSYYHKNLLQIDSIFEAAAQRRISPTILSAFEHMKNELLDVANVSGPIDSNNKIQIEKLIYTHRKITEKYTVVTNDEDSLINDQCRQKMSSIMNWDYDWLNFDNSLDFWPSYTGNDSAFHTE